MWNKAKCILLKTKENSGLLLGLSKFGRLVSYDTKYVNLDNDAYNVKQHLYIINDDVIKVNDWYLVELFKITGESIGLQLEQCKSINDVWINNSDVTLTRHIENCKKVIATTDKSLVALFGNDEEGYRKQKEGLPQIPQSFIEQYITEYNKGNIINEVLVEYIQSADSFYGLDVPIELKINQDNTINIKTVKDSFSKEEVKQLLYSFRDNIEDQQCSDERIDKFIEQNL